MVKTFFITGTDTGCGKTYVTCQLLNYLHSLGHSALALKPVACGLIQKNGRWVSEDVLLLEQHNQNAADDICRWQFKAPVSPHIAAAREGKALSIKDIADFCSASHFPKLDYLLIEGAGGLMVPLNPQETWLDFLRLTAMPVILVVGMRLGCLNHALLTDSVLKKHHVTCAGWVANCLDNHMLALEDNIELLAQTLNYPQLATVGYQAPLSSQSFQSECFI